MEKETTMQPGVYDGISNSDYHGGQGISKSGLDLLARSPMHLKWAMDAANDNPPTAAQKIGTAAHALILEPEVFAQEYCLALRQQDVPEAIDDREQLVAMVQDLNAKRLPKLSASGSKAELVARLVEATAEFDEENRLQADQLEAMKVGELKQLIEKLNEHRAGLLSTSGSRHQLADLLRENGVDVTLWSDVKSEWETNNGHRTVLSQDEWDQLHAMRDAVMAHPVASKLLTGVPGKAEPSVYWKDPVTCELCRCRPDYWREDGILVDLKTTDDAGQESFSKSLANWRYHVQHPYYLDGCGLAIEQAGLDLVKPKHFLFLVVEKRAPYGVAVYQLDQESVDLGRDQYRQDLDLFHQCRMIDQWPGYGARIQSIGVPQWYLLREVQ